jgi:hypothetical protein
MSFVRGLFSSDTHTNVLLSAARAWIDIAVAARDHFKSSENKAAPTSQHCVHCCHIGTCRSQNLLPGSVTALWRRMAESS